MKIPTTDICCCIPAEVLFGLVLNLKNMFENTHLRAVIAMVQATSGMMIDDASE
jgi:hypothetical protein